MAYIEVIIQNGSSGPIAESANGVSLAREKGCLWLFIGGIYPMAEDYVRGLEYEGWRLTNTSATSTMGMFDGIPFGGSHTKLIFIGDGRYQIEWVGERWNFKGYSNVMYEREESEEYYDYDDSDPEHSDHWGPV